MRFSFVRLVFSFLCLFFCLFELFSKIGRVAAMILVQKSSKSEVSSRFFGRLKIFEFKIFRRWCPGGGVSGSGETLWKSRTKRMKWMNERWQKFVSVDYLGHCSRQLITIKRGL